MGRGADPRAMAMSTNVTAADPRARGARLSGPAPRRSHPVAADGDGQNPRARPPRIGCDPGNTRSYDLRMAVSRAKLPPSWDTLYHLACLSEDEWSALDA